MRLKKAFAVILAIAMVFGAVSMASAASKVASTDFADIEDSNQANAIVYLKALGVVKGDAGTNNYRPGDFLTRQEFVVLVARALGQELTAEYMAGYAPDYTDADEIADWAVGAVNLATTNGWVKGYDDGAFHPKDNLTLAQAATVYIRALGHEPEVVGGYPAGYLAKAVNVGLSKGVVPANTPITRADMARVSYNALFTPTRVLNPAGTAYVNGETLSAESTKVGIVNWIDAANSEIELNEGTIAAPDDHEYDLADEVTLIGASSLAAVRGLNVRVTLNADSEVFVIEVVKAGQSGSAYVFDKAGGKAGARTMVMADGSSIKVDGDTEIIINEDDLGDIHGYYAEATKDDSVVEFLDDLNKGDEIIATVAGGVATQVLVTQLDVTDVIVTSITKATDDDLAIVEGYEYDDAAKTTAEFSVRTGASVYLNGTIASVSDIKANDVIQVATEDRNGFGDEEALKVVATRSTARGTVESNIYKLLSNGDYRVSTTLKLEDGTKKTVAWLATETNVGDGTYPSEGNTAILLLNADGSALLDTAGVAATQYVKVLSAYNDGTDNFVEIDNAGVTKTYKTTFAFTSAHLNSVGTVTVNANAVTNFVAAAGFADATVQSVSGDYVVVKVGANTFVAVTPAIYEFKTGDKAGNNLAASSLSVGDAVRVDATNSVILKK